MEVSGRQKSSGKKIDLDLKDRKILFELDFNSRSPISEIARKVGLSKQTVDYKIKNMVRSGVIAGFWPVINNQKLGYVYGRLFIKTHNLTEEKESKIMSELIDNPMVCWIMRAEGAYDLFVSGWFRTLGEFKRFSDDILSKHGLYVKEIRESIGIELNHFPPRFLIDSKSRIKITTREDREFVKLSDIERKILVVLCENSRRTVVEMSKGLGISPKVLTYHLRRLEEKGVIMGYRITLNYNMLGYSYYKIFFSLTNVTSDSLARFREFFQRDSRLIYIIDALGMANFDAELVFKSQTDFFDFLHDMKFKFPNTVKEYDAMVITDTLKVNFLPHDFLKNQ